MTITKLIKFNKLQEENETLKKELAEKDKEIEKLKQQQLYKENFDEYCQYVNGRREDTYIIKDKSLYKKLPSKDVK
jgi:cell division protein FtsB